MAGITRYGSYVPYARLKRSAFGAGRGERAAAGHDEDSVSMAVEAARDALRDAAAPDTLIFASTSPPYAEKSNAATIASALALPGATRSVELAGSARMGLGGLLLALDLAHAGVRSLVCAADVVVGNPGGAREATGGDAAAAFLVGADAESLAVVRGRASATTELIDVWRLPDERFARQWEERFGAQVLGPVAMDVIRRALEQAGVTPASVSRVILDAANQRVVGGIVQALGFGREQLHTGLHSCVGWAGVANAGLMLADTLDRCPPGETILVVSATDGCDALVLETTAAIDSARPRHCVAHWLASRRDDLAYTDYLKWRGVLPFEPPRRPDPERPAAPASRRGEGWKMSFYGVRCEACGTANLPPQRVCLECGSTDRMVAEAFADARARVATFTLDHLAWSLQPPVIAAVVDFDAGGRISCELTDLNPAEVRIGMELEMSFRRLYTGQGIHNYFWKARPRR